jgi:biotin carboxyl carrier protein
VKFWVALDGRDAEVEFHTEEGRVWIEVEGRRVEADFHRLPDGEVYSLLVNGRSHEVRVSPAQAGVLEVSLEGSTFPVEVRHPLEKALQSVARAGGTAGIETIAAPMPGLVVEIRVHPGERVAAGQPVIVVEAMKMQNELSAHRGGIVTEVLVTDRAPVSAGQSLVRIRAESA